jgi:hypothetical protein
MSNSKVNVTAASVFANAKHTHYTVSTAAAVVYALVWLLSNGAHAETSNRQAAFVLPPVVVTAYPNLMPEVVVVGKREPRETVAVLDAVVVTAKRDNDTRVAAIAAGNSAPIASASGTRVGSFAKVRNWFRATLAKVSG